jgi:hypothetical protein
MRLGVPLAFHGTSGGASADYVSNRFRGHPNFRTLNHASSFPLELMLAMGAILVGGVLEKFPDLRVGFLEGNCGWLPWWLHRLDDQWEKYGGGESVKLSALPSEYFGRQCFIGTDVDEELLQARIFVLKSPSLIYTALQCEDSCGFQHEDGLPGVHPQWVSNTTSRFSCPSTAPCGSIFRDRGSPRTAA